MDEVLCRTVFLRSINVLVSQDSIDYFLIMLLVALNWPIIPELL